tara:strand:- start:515 stop:700 length:186 start_codon:yes stop_codon:yes gene_type:complete
MADYVVIRDMGDEGGQWQETKIFFKTATIKEVMDWGMFEQSQQKYSHRRITLTKPHPNDGE